MLTDKQKYDFYVKTYNRVERGWTQRTLESRSGGACLVGAINYAVSGKENIQPDYWYEDFSTRHTPETRASREIQIDLATAILPPKKRFLLSPTTIRTIDVPLDTTDDGGLSVIETWNDRHTTTKEDVLALIQKRIDHYKPLVRDQEVERLRAEIASLTGQLVDARARVAVLEAQVDGLQKENNLLRVSKTKYTAGQLRDESDTLRDLDDHLNSLTAELAEWGVNA